MRIESLTLHNLNALRGRWHIDFNPLAGSGIFAITGPTGAGKSTILDALCLALYGQTPRLGKISAGSNELMSRHTGECSAEVVIAVDGRRYRIFWGQKRARGKADGKLQAARHEIADADSGAILEDKLSRTAQRVEALTGLDFERFVRAVLLAQGQFAAFLHAGADERAPILEQITGTAIYSRLSVAVHARYSAEMQTLQTLQGSSEQLALPDAETLAQLAQHIENAQQAVAQTKAARDAGLALRTRYHECARQEALAEQLAAQWRQAQSDWVALEPLRDALARHQRALPALAPYRDWQREQAEEKALDGKLAQGRVQEEQLQQSLVTVAQQAQTLAQRWQAALQAEQQAQPLLQQAREQDSAYRHLQSRAAEWQVQLQSHAFADADTLHALAALQVDKAALDAQYRQMLDGRSAEAWQEMLDAARERYGALRELLQWQGERQGRAEEIHALQGKHAALERAWQQALQVAENARQALAAATEKTADKRRILEQARLIRSFAEHRAHLRAGEPCPLCGALAHPYAQGQALPDDDQSALREAEAAEQQARQALQQAQTASVQSERDMLHLRAGMAEKEQALAALEARVAQGLQDWQVADGDAAQALQACEAEGKAIGARLRTLHELQAQREQAEQVAQARQWQHGMQALTALEAEMQANRTARAALLPAADVEDYAAQLRAALEQAAQAQSAAQQQLIQTRERLGALQAEMRTLQTLRDGHAGAAEQAQAAFADAVAAAGFADAADWQAARQEEAQIAVWQNMVQQAAALCDSLQVRLADSERQWQALRAALPGEWPDGQELDAQVENDEAQYADALQTQGRLLAEQAEYARREALLAARREEIAAQSRVCDLWRQMHDLIGSADGKKFRLFAQGLTFDVMIAYANRELAKMSDRYVLVRAQDGHLALDVMDDWQGGEVRTTKNLSGGEQFIVSLALALGLSAMAGEKIRIDSLFLDEGFGTLDEQALDQALDTLASLPAQGKLIGIISHVGALRERIGTQIQVVPQSGGVSRLQGEGVEEW